MKKAIILAAGKGQRLGHLTSMMPKCLLELEDGVCFLDLSLQALKNSGLNEVVMISGHKSEVLEHHIRDTWKNEFTFHFVFNDRHDTWNNIYSAYLARNYFDDETILLNSDILYDPAILMEFVTAMRIEKGKISYLIVDDNRPLDEEDMKVEVSLENTIKKIHKSLDPKKAHGEYIGILSLRGRGRELFFEVAEKLIQNGENSLYYEDALAHILDHSTVSPFSTSGRLWAEVDTIEDFVAAKSLYQRLKKRQLM